MLSLTTGFGFELGFNEAQQKGRVMSEHINQVFMEHIANKGLGPLVDKGLIKIMNKGQIDGSDTIMVIMDIGGRLFSIRVHEIIQDEIKTYEIPKSMNRINHLFDNDCG